MTSEKHGSKKVWLLFWVVLFIFGTVMYFRGYQAGDNNKTDMSLMNEGLRVVKFGFEPSETALREIGSEEMSYAVSHEEAGIVINEHYNPWMCDMKRYNCAVIEFKVRKITGFFLVSFNKRNDAIEDIHLSDTANMLFTNRFGDVKSLVYRDKLKELDKYADKDNN